MVDSRFKYHFDFTEKRLKEDFIKLADELIVKVDHCKRLMNMDLLPLMSSDTGIREMQCMNNVLFALSKLKEINHEIQLEKRHARLRKKSLNKR